MASDPRPPNEVVSPPRVTQEESCTPPPTARSIQLTRRDPDTCQHSQVEVWAPQHLEGDEAVVVWDAALVLAYFLERHQSEFLSGPASSLGRPVHLVDVGAGTGAVGLAAAALGASVTLTDLDRIQPLLEEGIRLNKAALRSSGVALRAAALTWGSAEEVEAVCGPFGPPDLITVSDCVYYQASVAPLVFTLKELSKLRRAPVLLSYEDRDYSLEKKKVKDQFFDLAERYFRVSRYTSQDCHETYASDDIHVVRLDPIIKAS